MRKLLFFRTSKKVFEERKFLQKISCTLAFVGGQRSSGCNALAGLEDPLRMFTTTREGRGATLGCVSCKSHATAFDAKLSGEVG